MPCPVSFVRRRDGGHMASIREVPEGTTLLDAARAARLPIARACAGRGLCGRCDVEVLDGHAFLSPDTPEERETRERDQLPASRRLACRARVHGPVRVSAGYW